MADQQASSPVAAQPVSAIDALFGGDTEEDAGDPFAQLGGEATAKGEAAPRQPEDKVEPQDEEDPAPAVLAEESARPLSDPPPPAALDDKDFSDLLAEFEEEHVEEETPPVQPDLHAATEGAITPAAILIDDDQGPSAFDELLANADQFPDTDSPPPDLSIERSRPASQSSVHDGDTSLLSNTTDWLADTSMEDYFQKKPVRAVSVDTNGDEPVSFEVPQGWFDDQGNWRWYTEEEKEQVRLTMISQGGWDLPGDDGTKAAVQGEKNICPVWLRPNRCHSTSSEQPGLRCKCIGERSSSNSPDSCSRLTRLQPFRPSRSLHSTNGFRLV